MPCGRLALCWRMVCPEARLPPTTERLLASSHLGESLVLFFVTVGAISQFFQKLLWGGDRSKVVTGWLTRDSQAQKRNSNMFDGR